MDDMHSVTKLTRTKCKAAMAFHESNIVYWSRSGTLMNDPDQRLSEIERVRLLKMLNINLDPTIYIEPVVILVSNTDKQYAISELRYASLSRRG